MHGYTEIQNRVADLVKKFGGEGRIHGCIVDIDFYNHVYINPYDLKITYYYAIDMTQKWYYSSLEKLLKGT